MPLLQHEGGNSVDKRSMREIMTTTLIFIITVYTLGALHVQCYEGTTYFFFLIFLKKKGDISIFTVLLALFPTWASTPANQGGLGFTSTEIGTLMSISNTAMLFTQLVVLPRLTKRWSMTRIIQCLLASCLIMSFVIGLWRFPLLHNDSMWISVGLLLCMIIQSVGQNITLTLSGILINTSVKHPNTLGFVNGIAQSKYTLFYRISHFSNYSLS